ncbi:unnamed protein product, partial [Dibothriocephalus latus]
MRCCWARTRWASVSNSWLSCLAGTQPIRLTCRLASFPPGRAPPLLLHRRLPPLRRH